MHEWPEEIALRHLRGDPIPEDERERDRPTREECLADLRHSSGLDFGDDVAAWAAWVEQRRAERIERFERLRRIDEGEARTRRNKRRP